jgi:hypothetical protein
MTNRDISRQLLEAGRALHGRSGSPRWLAILTWPKARCAIGRAVGAHRPMISNKGLPIF